MKRTQGFKLCPDVSFASCKLALPHRGPVKTGNGVVQRGRRGQHPAAERLQVTGDWGDKEPNFKFRLILINLDLNTDSSLCYWNT